MPGNVTSRNSFGTNYLIKGAGAKLVQQWQDVAAELPPEIAARLLPPEPKKKRGKDAGTTSSTVEGAASAKENGTANTTTTSVTMTTSVPRDLTDDERAVLRLIASDEPSHIDALASESKLSLPSLTSALLGLEMRELVRQLPGKCFVKKL